MAHIEPLTEVLGTSQPGPIGDRNVTYYTVTCRECGVVSDKPDVTIVMAALYRQRHLAEHLTALAEEITRAAR